ncbi:MAG TPA: NADH-quinone oxidoreductase subunit F, partial [Syntrophomonadaceae bacterium]|nr:NADH-quinone oxidoreductase subunit F [Syntrophomonadaceae bacterium]
MIIRIGLGSCGIAAGAKQIKEAVEQEIAATGLNVEIKQTGCIGTCHNEPLLDVITDDGKVFTFEHVTAEMVKTIFEEYLKAGQLDEKCLTAMTNMTKNYLDGQIRIALRNCGRIDPEQIEDYISCGGYEALKKVTAMTPLEVIEEIKIS